MLWIFALEHYYRTIGTDRTCFAVCLVLLRHGHFWLYRRHEGEVKSCRTSYGTSGEYCNHGCYPTVVSNGRWASSSITQKRPQKEKMKPKRKKQLLYLIHIIRSINTKLTAVFDTREHCTPHQRALPGGWWPSKSTSSPRAILHKHKSYWKQLAQRALFPAQHRSGVRW